MIIDYSSYPFLAGLEETIKMLWPGLKLYNIISEPESRVLRRALHILETVITKNKIPKPSGYTSEEEILAFYTLLTALKMIGDRKLLSRIAVAYAKNAWYSLRREPLNTLTEIARILGLKVGISGNPPKIPVKTVKNTLVVETRPVMIDVFEYLEYTTRLINDPKYMLVNQILHGGYVFLEKEVFTRILEEVIMRRIIEKYEQLEVEHEKYVFLREKVEEILKRTGWYDRMNLEARIEESTTGVIDQEAFPPCMKQLINRLVNGENLGHHERFVIAAFLARIGLSTESILEYFKHSPDYNEKIARYQIEHIAGLRGSRKKYLPYNCDTMKSYGLCPIEGYCRGGRNPLAVYKRNVWVKIRGGKGGEAGR